jgi:hypothetical protein
MAVFFSHPSSPRILPPGVVRTWMALGLLSATAAAAFAGVTTDAVIQYMPGTISNSGLQQNGNAAIGLPASVDDGQTSPFTPPFHASSITIIGPGGDIVLHFAAPVVSTGRDIGVFTNTGLAGKTTGGITTATGGTLGQADTAFVSVSDTGLPGSFVALNGGNPIDLTMPSNAFDDATISASGFTATGGTLPANPFEPFTGSLSDFTGLTYPGILTLLNGSFGGAWIDASSAGLAQINYIEFDVPAGDRLVLDAVTAENAVPEPASLGFLALAMIALRVRRPRRGAV